MILRNSHFSYAFPVSSEYDKGFWKQFWFTNVAYTTYFFFGLVRGYPLFLIPQMELEKTVKSIWDVSVLTGVSFFLNPVGSVIAGFIMDKWGRKSAMIASLLMFCLGWTYAAFSTAVVDFLVANIIIGVASGMAACSPAYVVEISDTKYRSMFLSILEVHFALGVLVATVSTSYLDRNNAAAIFSLLAVLATFILLSIPETPHFLMKKRRVTEALNSFCRLKNSSNAAGLDEILRRTDSNDSLNRNNGILVIFRQNIRSFLILCGIHALLQGCGYSALLTHLTTFLKNFSFLECDIKWITIGFVVCQFLVSFLTPFTVYFWSRKKVFILSGIGMAIPLAIISVAHHSPAIPFVQSVKMEYLVSACLYCYVTACSIGILTLSQAMIGELYPTDARGQMVGVTEAMGFILGGLAVSAFPELNQTLGPNVLLYFFTTSSVVTILFGYFLLPETYGKTLNEIQVEYFPREEGNIQERCEKKGAVA